MKFPPDSFKDLFIMNLIFSLKLFLNGGLTEKLKTFPLEEP